MRICLIEDAGVANLEPLHLTRPVFELVCGITSLRTKQVRHFQATDLGVLIRPSLADLFRIQEPTLPINDYPWLQRQNTIVVNSRWLPPPDVVNGLSGPCFATVGDEFAYAVVGPDRLAKCAPRNLEDCLESWHASLPHRDAGGHLIHFAWDLVNHNAEQLRQDFAHGVGGVHPGWRPKDLTVVGSCDQLAVDPSAHIDPQVVVDTRTGPVVIDKDVVISAFTRLEGPCYIGPKTQLLGAKIRGGVTLGAQCRIGGEVETSVVHGYSNKYHEGFLGHSYLGEWVNFGAGTHCSDLRNDYAEVIVYIGGEPVRTGTNKVGCFVGDHTKTGLGTLLNTGSNLGAFCNLLPSGRLLPKYFPSFTSWWNGALAKNEDLAALLETTAVVMQRRGLSLLPAHEQLYQFLLSETAAHRASALSEAERRRRQSA